MAGQSYQYTLTVDAEANTKSLENLISILTGVLKLEQAVGNQNIDINTRQAEGNLKSLDGQVGNTTKNVKSLDGQDVNINTKNGVNGLQTLGDKAADAKQEVNGFDSSSIDAVGRSADTAASKLERMGRASKTANKGGSSLSSSFQNMSSGLSGNGMMSYLGLGSAYENTIGNAMTKEINDVTMGNSLNFDKGTIDYIDKRTSQSMTRMNNLIPALNAGMSATGKNMKPYIDNYIQMSDAVMALGYSEAEATTAMYDLSKGLNGAFASLDQYGISEASLMATGLWSGKADDVDGYFKAVSKVLPKTSKYMDTFQGDIIGLKKVMSSAGGSLGKEILPKLRPIAQGIKGLLTDSKGDANGLAKALMGAFMAFSAVQPIADSLGTVMDTFRTIKGAATGAAGAVKTVIARAKGLKESIQTKGVKGTILDKFRNKGMDDPCADEVCCDDVCLDSAKKLGKEKKKNGQITQQNQKQQSRGLDKSTDRKGLQNKTRGMTKNSFASDIEIPKKQKNHLGTDLSKSGNNAGKGFMKGLGNSIKNGSKQITGPLSKGMGGALGKIGGLVGGIGSSFLSLLGPIALVVTAVTMILGILDMLGIDWMTPLQEAFGGLGDTIMSSLSGIGSQLMSVLGPAFNDLMNALSGIWTGIQPAISAIGEAFGAILPILGMIGQAIISNLVQRFQMLYTVGAAIWTAIGPVLTAIGQALYKVGHIIYDVLSKLDFGPAGDSASDFVSTIGGLAESVASFLQPVVDFIDNLDFSSVTNFINDVISGIQTIGNLAMSVLGPVGDAIGGLFGGASEGLDTPSQESGGPDLSGLSEGLSGVAGTVQTIVQTVIDTLSSGILTLVQGLFDIVTGGITNVINSIGTNIAMIITTIATSLMGVITTIGTTIMGIFSTIFAGVSGILATMAAGIVAVISTIAGSISGIIGSIGASISGIVGSIGGAISGVIGTVAGAIGTVISALSSGVVSVVNSIVNGFNQIASTINGQLVAGVAALAAGFVALTTSVTAFVAVGTPGFVAMAASILPLAAALTGVCAQLITAATSVTVMSTGFMSITSAITAINTGLAMATVMMTTFGASITAIQGVMSSVFGAFPGIVNSSMSSAMSIITSWCSRVVALMRSTATRMASGYKSGIQGIKAATESEMRGAYESLSSWGDKMVAKARQVASDVANAFPENYDVGSPGIIWRTTKNEMRGTYESLASYESPMVKAASAISRGVVGAFTRKPISSNVSLPSIPNASTVPSSIVAPQSSNSGDMTVNNTVHIGNVTISNGEDKDKFLKDIIRALDFETTRAGRRVGNRIVHS